MYSVPVAVCVMPASDMSTEAMNIDANTMPASIRSAASLRLILAQSSPGAGPALGATYAGPA